MTHDELLVEINRYLVPTLAESEVGNKAIGVLKALRAVVELHKPKEENEKLWCEQELCYNHIEFLERDKCDCSYPCPTMQAIEKELG